MAKAAAQTTLMVRQFMPLYEVFEDEWQAIEEMLNWAACYRNPMHVSLACGPDDWEGSSSVRTIGVSFPAASGWNSRLFFRIVVPPETQTIRFGARCFISTTGGTQTGQIRITCGASGAINMNTGSPGADFLNSNNATQHTLTMATSSTGTGELDVNVEINHTVGSATDCFLRTFLCEEVINTVTSLPDPADT